MHHACLYASNWWKLLKLKISCSFPIGKMPYSSTENTYWRTRSPYCAFPNKFCLGIFCIALAVLWCNVSNPNLKYPTKWIGCLDDKREQQLLVT